MIKLSVLMMIVISLIFLIFWPYEPKEVTINLDKNTQDLILKNTPENERSNAKIHFMIITSAGEKEGEFIYQEDVRFHGRVLIQNPGNMSSGYTLRITRPDGVVHQIQMSRPKSWCIELNYKVEPVNIHGEISSKSCGIF